MKNLNVVHRTLIGLALVLMLTNSALNLSLMRENTRTIPAVVLNEANIEENIEQIDENIVYNNMENKDAFYIEGEVTLLNINLASKEQFLALEGIDEELANNIMKYKDERGGFINCEELKLVNGMDNYIYNIIKSEITIMMN